MKVKMKQITPLCDTSEKDVRKEHDFNTCPSCMRDRELLEGNKVEDWEKEFDEEILKRPLSEGLEIFLVPQISNLNKLWLIENVTKDVKFFIRSLLAQQKKEIEKRVREMKIEYKLADNYRRGYNQALTDVLELLSDKNK